MVCSIAPFSAWIDGDNTATQGGYPFTLDTAVELTFDPGNVSTARHDRIIAWVKDDTYDSSGYTEGSVEILKGNTTTGVATALPDNAMLLYDVEVPVGASAGGSGITFSSAATDERVYTTASGGVVPVVSEAARDAIASPHKGALAYREDTDWVERHDGTQWRPTGIPIVSSVGNLSLITDPIQGDLAMVTSVDKLYRYTGSAWVRHSAGDIIAYGSRISSTSSSSSTHEVLLLNSGYQVYDGRMYEISTSALHGYSADIGLFIAFYLTYTTNGSTPDSGSSVLSGTYVQSAVSNGYTATGIGTISTVYKPSSDHTLKLCLVITGVGSGSYYAFATTNSRIHIKVVDLGDAVTATGTIP
jgi:hypothetical protein